MTAVLSFCMISALLVAGKILRIAIPVLQRLYLPSSIIGGLLGLCIFSIFGSAFPAAMFDGLNALPGFLINVVFAGLFLGVATPGFRKVAHLAIPQLCFGQITAWGQYVVGIGLTLLVLAPLFGVDPAFGNLLEIGFEGGHGTVGGMSHTFNSFSWSDGIALGYTVATIGMVLGVTIGMVLINIAFRLNFVSGVTRFADKCHSKRRGLYRRNEMPEAGKQTVQADSIDSLAWHIALIGIAIFMAWTGLKLLQMAECALFPAIEGRRLLSGFPLFPLCMICGLVLQRIATWIGQDHLIDHGQMQRLSGASLDFLVVAALSTIRLDVVMRNLPALAILCVCGLIWNVVLVFTLGPYIFKEAWFERSIAEFGQSTGVTATGLLLLRTVDPENKTVAAQSFGYKQLLHEPVMGGGLWTATALTLVFTIGAWPVFFISLGALIFWGVIMLVMRKRWMAD